MPGSNAPMPMPSSNAAMQMLGSNGPLVPMSGSSSAPIPMPASNAPMAGNVPGPSARSLSALKEMELR